MFNPFNIFKRRKNICDRYSITFIKDLILELGDDGIDFAVCDVLYNKKPKGVDCQRAPYWIEKFFGFSKSRCYFKDSSTKANAYLIWYNPNKSNSICDFVRGHVRDQVYTFLKQKKETFNLYDIKVSNKLYTNKRCSGMFDESVDFILY